LKILFLGPKKDPQKKIIEFLTIDGNSVSKYENRLILADISDCAYNLLISFGYCYMVREDVLDYFKGKAINLHISYLPWNKGADPNLWSILENTPKGVTIHQMDYDLDAGKILYQKEFFFDDDDSLRSSYEKLQNEIVVLFKEKWEYIKSNKVMLKNQQGSGSYHKSSDKNIYKKLLTNGWDTKIKDLIGKAINV